MKAVFVIILAIVLLFAATTYFDFVAQNQVYKFCSLFSSGNSIDQVSAKATEHQFEIKESNSSSMVLINPSYLTFNQQYACVIQLKDAKVISQSIVEQ